MRFLKRTDYYYQTLLISTVVGESTRKAITGEKYYSAKNDPSHESSRPRHLEVSPKEVNSWVMNSRTKNAVQFAFRSIKLDEYVLMI